LEYLGDRAMVMTMAMNRWLMAMAMRKLVMKAMTMATVRAPATSKAVPPSA